MADEEKTPTLGKVLENVYKGVKQSFEGLWDMFIKDPKIDLAVKYIEAEELTRAKTDEIISVTNNQMADAAENNNRDEIKATSRQGNTLLSLVRDNYSATQPRIIACQEYVLYIGRALNEADPTDPKQSDGMLLTGIRRVDL